MWKILQVLWNFYFGQNLEPYNIRKGQIWAAITQISLLSSKCKIFEVIWLKIGRAKAIFAQSAGFVYPFVCSSVRSSIRPSIRSSVRLFVRPSICLSVCSSCVCFEQNRCTEHRIATDKLIGLFHVFVCSCKIKKNCPFRLFLYKFVSS